MLLKVALVADVPCHVARHLGKAPVCIVQSTKEVVGCNEREMALGLRFPDSGCQRLLVFQTALDVGCQDELPSANLTTCSEEPEHDLALLHAVVCASDAVNVRPVEHGCDRVSSGLLRLGP